MNRDHQSASVEAPLRRSVTLTPVAGRCGGGECPTVYRTDRGTLVVQGYTVEPAQAGVSIPAGEQLVEIPVDLIAEYLNLTA